MADRYDVLAIGAHPDDLEVVMGGTAVRLSRSGRSVLFADLSDGEPARHASPGVRREQADRAAQILGVDRTVLEFPDRFIRDTVETRIAVANLIRSHRPRYVFTTEASGVHPDHKAITEIVVNGIFYARLPKWKEVPGGEALGETDPHEIDRLFFGHCRMESPWERFDFAVDVTEVYDLKLAALAGYESVFGADQEKFLERFRAADRYVGSLVGVRYAEAFKARSPLLVHDPTVLVRACYG